jgi:hypothetical protein
MTSFSFAGINGHITRDGMYGYCFMETIPTQIELTVLTVTLTACTGRGNLNAFVLQSKV